MQYKNATKIIIDKRKLDILIRIGCPDNQLLQLIKTGSFSKTGDSLIDETLECLADFKDFKNWGGNHNPKGISGYNKKKNNRQVDGQVDEQDCRQVVDKDIDKDNIYLNNIPSTTLKKEIYKESFDEFWKIFPKQRAGSKQKAYTSYCRAIKEKRCSVEKLLDSAKAYAVSDEVKRGYAKGCAAWLNDDRFNIEYNHTNIFGKWDNF